MTDLELPQRYEPLARLGKGGGGEVWSVRDRHSDERYALKILAEGAGEGEMAALVREAVALSGLEGLGVPRVVRYGRLPKSGRAYLVRELVEGRSLEELIDQGVESERILEALARAADQLTVLHRAGMLHGDVKPANVIVEPRGGATLVDLGLAAPLREGGTPAEGLTPRYAAPELFQGKPLTVRAEVYALGAALDQALERLRHLAPRARSELRAVAARATARTPAERFPSADEFASALRRAAGLPAADLVLDTLLWPVVGIDGTSAKLLEAARALAPGEVLHLDGPPGSGRTALLRRLAWSLEVAGEPALFVDDAAGAAPKWIDAELADHASPRDVTILVDDALLLAKPSLERIERARAAGARVVVTGGSALSERARVFELPALDAAAASELVRRAVPSLTEPLVKKVIAVSGGRPGELRRVVRMIAAQAVVSSADIERAIGSGAPPAPELSGDQLERAVHFLDRGRYIDARAALDAVDVDADALALAIAWSRLELGIGEAAAAVERLEAAEPLAKRQSERFEARQWSLYLGRALIGVADYARALAVLEPLAAEGGSLGAEALAYRGLASSFAGRHDLAKRHLTEAVERAGIALSPRVEGIALASLGLVLQRSDEADEAKAAYVRAIAAAERAGDASTLATSQLNLAGLLKMTGDVAGAMDHFEAAVDMGRRAGRAYTTRDALLNLANADLYLGRIARARAGIEALDAQRAQLPPVARAQLLGLEAEYAARAGELEQCERLYERCAQAYDALGRTMDAAEARLERVLVATRGPRPDPTELRRVVDRTAAELGNEAAHKPLLLLATARVQLLAGEEGPARASLEQALSVARGAGQREWVWRTLETRAELEQSTGQPLSARRDREEALAVLETISARLPRDLREVYWNEPRRRALRESVHASLGLAAVEHQSFGSAPREPLARSSISTLSSTPLEQRLARILEVNSELVGEYDVERLTGRVTDYAVELLRAERGFVLLREESGALTVHTSRSRFGDEEHAEFSRSIAESVIKSGNPLVSLSARDDARMQGFASVHALMLKSVACVPILAPAGSAIGALYVETRTRAGLNFERELPTLSAFADQVAIAIENARLINENLRRADELARANERLEEANQRVRELLGDRTEQLKRARRKLRETRDTLYGHFGYHGLVGTSAAMRKVYALIERIKDTSVPVLLTGESGTGKEMVARAIHAASERGKRKFLGVNCGAIPEHLLESELFGNVRGAYTGADRERKGLFREAEGGTILLDEIGEMPHKMQSGLLRVLQDRTVRPVGGTDEEPVDVRVIFATNRDLTAMVKAGQFREDLYYRIHVVEVRLPSLRDRIDDLPPLVDHFFGIFAARYKRDKKTITKSALRRLAAFHWPGNVRQLEHVLLNAAVLTEEPELDAVDFDLPDSYVPEPARGAAPAPAAPVPGSAHKSEPRPERTTRNRRHSLSQHRNDERDRIIKALEAANWNRVKAAELSGIPRRTFYRRLREYGIQ